MLIILKYAFKLFLFNFFFLILGKAISILLKKLIGQNNLLSLNITLGLFVIGSYSFIFNFFSGTLSIFFLSILLITFFSSLLIIYFNKEIKYLLNKKNILILLFLSFFLFIYSNQLPPGYDAGLYHIPHQVFIQNEKIIFGLVNMHERFGLSTFYNYIAALLWFDNDFTFVSFLQSIYLIIFFLFLYEILKIKKKIYDIIVFSTLLTMPIWFRYNISGFSLVDLPYSIFFYISVILSILILNKETKKKETYFFYFTITFSLSFMHKSNGVLLFPLFLTILFFVYNNFKIKKLFFYVLSIPTAIVILWLFRTVIITGCFVYPVKMTCLDFFWINDLIAEETLGAIKNWSFRGIEFLNINLFYKYIMLIFFSLLLLIIFFKYFNLKKILFKNNFFLILALICLFYIYSRAEALVGFSSMVTEQRVENINSIFFNEIFLITSSTILSLYLSIKLNSFENYYSLNKAC